MLLLRLEPVPECGFKHCEGVVSVVVGGDPLLEALDGVGLILGLEGEVPEDFLFLAQQAHQFLLYLHEPALLLLHCLPHALLQSLYVGQCGSVHSLQTCSKDCDYRSGTMALGK